MESLQRNLCWVALILFCLLQVDWIWKHFEKKWYLLGCAIQGGLLFLLLLLTFWLIRTCEKDSMKKESQSPKGD